MKEKPVTDTQLHTEPVELHALHFGQIQARCIVPGCHWKQTYTSIDTSHALRVARIAAKAHARKAHGLQILRQPGEDKP